MSRNTSHIPSHTGLPSQIFHKSEQFLETSPRPPVPGAEETLLEGNSSFRYQPMQGDATPRKSAYQLSGNGYVPSPYSEAPNGFEPDGCCSTISRGYRETPPPLERTSPPSYLQWARKLSSLLEDRQGVELFKKYVEQEGGVHADRLNFYFACEGLKLQTDSGKVKQMIGAIYRFLRKSQLSVPEELRRRVKLGLRDDQELSSDIYNSMQAEVEQLINDTTYPNFLRSDIYLSHVQIMQSYQGNYADASDTCSSSSSSSAQVLSCSQSNSALPTLHEDLELGGEEPILPNEQPGVAPRLTKDLLMATQRRRLDQRPRQESFASLLSRGYSVYSHPHAAYSSYNPVSRQDSEQQSMSSGRTDSDTMSMSGSSVDGISIGNRMHHSARHHFRHNRAIRENAQLNRDPNVHDMVIPRTQRVQKEQCLPMDPVKFAAILISKLEIVRRDQEMKEKLDRNIQECEASGESGYPGQQRALADALRERLQLDDDNDQDILDQHVSRVWSDLTPSRTPRGFNTPPIQNQHLGGPSSSKTIDPHHHPKSSVHRDRIDMFSTFSGDSGNVQDYHEFGTSTNTTMSKSHSMPDYNDAMFDRYNISRRSASKKTLTDLTDSGVSVMSGSMPINTSGNLGTRARASRVISWLMEGGQPQQAERYRKPFSRSSSMERHTPNSHISSDRERNRHDNQSVMSIDPNMPLLEEARRRLIEEERQNRQTKQRFSSIKPEAISAQSTLRRPAKRSTSSSSSMMGTVNSITGGGSYDPAASIALNTEHTVVVFSFCDEKFPYRTKIPGTMITLKQFKEILPKKGTYRYFFKTQCEELENQVIQEEIFNDADMLPLWEGKIMAQVKPCEQNT